VQPESQLAELERRQTLLHHAAAAAATAAAAGQQVTRRRRLRRRLPLARVRRALALLQAIRSVKICFEKSTKSMSRKIFVILYQKLSSRHCPQLNHNFNFDAKSCLVLTSVLEITQVY
jgi:hypothetical protein